MTLPRLHAMRRAEKKTDVYRHALQSVTLKERLDENVVQIIHMYINNVGLVCSVYKNSAI